MADIPVIPFAFANSLSCATVILLKSCDADSVFGATAFLAAGFAAAFGAAGLALAAGFEAAFAAAAFFAPEAKILSIWISVKAWRWPFLTLYPLRRFFLKTITLSPLRCFKTLAPT